MISDNILYDKQIELYVKQMFQLELFECFLKITVYTCLEITRAKTILQVREIASADKVLCRVLFFALIMLFDFFFGHPFEVVARIFLSTAKE